MEIIRKFYFNMISKGNNMVLNALICDDNQRDIDIIQRYFSQYCEEHIIEFECDTFTSGKEAIASDKFYNIAFLDVEIDSVTGIEIAKKLKKKNRSIVIFIITSYKKYMDAALDLYALRFLEKPFSHERFYGGVDRALELIDEEEIEFYLKESGARKRVMARDIVCIETDNHKTKITTVNGEYYSPRTIEAWDKQLTNVCFQRVHKSYIVNMTFIQKYERGLLMLLGNNFVGVSSRHQKNFRKVFHSFTGRE